MPTNIKRWKELDGNKKFNEKFKYGREDAQRYYDSKDEGKDSLYLLKEKAKSLIGVPEKNKDKYGSPNEAGFRMGVAEEVIKQGLENDDSQAVHLGAQVYMKFGPALGIKSFKGVANKLKQALEKDSQDDGINYKKDAEKFLTEMQGYNKKALGIEGKVLDSIFGISVVAGILFGVSSMTGAAIGFSNAPSGFLGAALFVCGIAGFFFSRRK